MLASAGNGLQRAFPRGFPGPFTTRGERCTPPSDRRPRRHDAPRLHVRAGARGRARGGRGRGLRDAPVRRGAMPSETFDPTRASAATPARAHDLALRRADGVLIATPAYHGGISGLVKRDRLHRGHEGRRPPHLDGRATAASSWPTARRRSARRSRRCARSCTRCAAGRRRSPRRAERARPALWRRRPRARRDRARRVPAGRQPGRRVRGDAAHEPSGLSPARPMPPIPRPR